MQDNEYDKYDLDYLIETFDNHHQSMVQQIEKAKIDYARLWPEDEYNPNEFSLHKALHVMAKEIKALRKDIEDLKEIVIG